LRGARMGPGGWGRVALCFLGVVTSIGASGNALGFLAYFFVSEHRSAVAWTRANAAFLGAAGGLGPRARPAVRFDDPVSVAARNDCGVARSCAGFDSSSTWLGQGAHTVHSSAYLDWCHADRWGALDESSAAGGVESSGG
jgi:hypothetical protein